jgi:hypothetical protein
MSWSLELDAGRLPSGKAKSEMLAVKDCLASQGTAAFGFELFLHGSKEGVVVPDAGKSDIAGFAVFVQASVFAMIS